MEGCDDEKWMFGESEKPYNIRHRCFHFAKDVILFVSEVECLQIHNSILDQLIRSATSIGANSVEGGSGSSKKDFIKFYAIALKSANETKFWLCIIRETLKCDKEVLNRLLNEAIEIANIIASILKSARQKQ